MNTVSLRIVLLLWAVALIGAARTPLRAGETPPSTAEVDAAIDLAANYLRANLAPSGRFAYERYLNPHRRPTGEYNLLRHAGTIYALGMAYARENDAPTLAAMTRAGGWLTSEALGPVPTVPKALAIWTRPRRQGVPTYRGEPYAKLGGAALALIAYVRLHEEQTGVTRLEDCRALAKFILSMQKDDGGFVSKYYLRRGPDDSWTSLYYPGEAMLALMRLYAHDPDPAWLNCAARGMACLARTRADDEEVPADHWALLATRELLRKYDALPEPPAPRAAILAHARQIVERILGDQVLDEASPVRGAFVDKGLVCPSAIRLEGLLAARDFLPADEPLRPRIEAAAHRGIRFLLQAQIREGRLAGGFPWAAAVVAANEDRRFQRRAEAVRIDYVQHALSALLMYADMRRE